MEVFLAVIRITVILFSIRMWCLVWILMICKPKTCTCIYNWRNPVICTFVYIFWKFDVPDWWTKEQCKTAVRMWKVWSHLFQFLLQFVFAENIPKCQGLRVHVRLQWVLQVFRMVMNCFVHLYISVGILCDALVYIYIITCWSRWWQYQTM